MVRGGSSGRGRGPCGGPPFARRPSAARPEIGAPEGRRVVARAGPEACRTDGVDVTPARDLPGLP